MKNQTFINREVRFVRNRLTLLILALIGCVTPTPLPEEKEVPMSVWINPRNPSTREKILKRNCRWYLNPYTYERGGWFEAGQHLITQDSEENSYLYKIYEIDDYGTGFINKECFR